jgi:hypothetical protein
MATRSAPTLEGSTAPSGPELVASLPMYDSLLSYESSGVLWSAIAKQLTSLQTANEVQLDKFSSCHALWTGEGLILSQACGYPLVAHYKDYLQVVGTPVYAAPGCQGPTYRSVVVARLDATINSLTQVVQTIAGGHGLAIAVNSFGSCSGWAMFLSTLSQALSKHSAALDSIGALRTVLTGSHIGSMKSVQAGHADIASIDCVTYALAQHHCPALLKGIKVIGWTDSAPALPFVTRAAASPKLLQELRAGLAYLVSSEEIDVVVSRQQHLLVGVTFTTTFELYEKAIAGLVDTIHKHPVTRTLFETLLPYDQQSIRDNISLKGNVVSNGGKNKDLAIQLDVKSKLEDASWPAADFAELHNLKQFLGEFLLATIQAHLQTLVVPANAPLTKQSLVAALAPVIGEQLWPTLPSGGKPKLIFCSLIGVLHLLRRVYTVDSADGWLGDPIWPAVAHCATEALQDLLDPEEAAAHELHTATSSPGGLKDIYFAGFMGAGASSLVESFAKSPNSATEGESAESADAGAPPTREEIVAKLWKADISLSTHLIRSSQGGRNGMVAYITGPRFNDRNDWANLVITLSEAAIDNWRTSRGHTAVRAHIAPYSYDHIRLHRGILKGGLHGLQLVLMRTVFLGPVPQASEKCNTLHALRDDCRFSNRAEDMDDNEKELAKLRILKEQQAAGGAGCPAHPHGLGFHRTPVYWADVSGISSLSEVRVPGGVHVSLREFKQQLEDEIRVPFVTVDASLTSAACNTGY